MFIFLKKVQKRWFVPDDIFFEVKPYPKIHPEIFTKFRLDLKIQANFFQNTNFSKNFK